MHQTESKTKIMGNILCLYYKQKHIKTSLSLDVHLKIHFPHKCFYTLSNYVASHHVPA